MQDPQRFEAEASAPSTTAARLTELMSHTTALDHCIAKNPAITPQLIAQLLERGAPGVEAQLAQNPNTPLPTLFRLGVAHAEALLQNPSLELFFIEDPGLLARFPEPVSHALLRSEQPLPLWLQRLFARHPSSAVRLRLLSRPAPDEEILAWFAQSKESFLRVELASRKTTPASILARLAEDPVQAVRQRLMENESTPCEVLCDMMRNNPSLLGVSRNIAKHPNIRKAILLIVEGEKPEILRGNPSFLQRLPNNALSTVLTFPETPDWILRSLSTHANEFARRRVGAHPNTPEETLARLSDDPSEHTRQGVAQNPRTPPAALRKLSVDRVERVRVAVAQNSSTHAKTLSALAIDPSPLVRGHAGQNPALYVEMIEYLARDRDALVRELVAQNPKAPVSLLKALCHDASAPVAKAASQGLQRRRQ